MAKKKKEDKLNGSQKTVLDLALAQINKDEKNKLAIGYFNKLPHLDLEVIPTGSISLDKALGVGGIPRGRVIEIFGPESSGKSTLCLHIVANAQKLGLVAAFIDMEHVFDPDYATALGVDMDKLLFSQPNSGSEAIRTTARLASTGSVGIVVLDSVASMATEAELAGDITDSHIGHQARLMSQALRILTPTIGKSNTTIIFTNQIRMKIGMMFGNPETTPGGNALKFYATQRLDIRRKGAIKEESDNNITGAETRVKVVKNKVAPPFKEAFFNIMFGKGIDAVADIVNCAKIADIIKKSGSWYSYKEEQIGQGETNVIAYLKNNPQMLEEITSKLKAIEE